MLKPCLLLLLTLAISTAVSAEEFSQETLQESFAAKILPLLNSQCLSCHDAETREAELDLSAFQTSQDVSLAHPIWELVLARVEAHEMPPADATRELSEDDRHVLAKWIRDFRHFESLQNAGDPGLVLPRRLSNAEYDYSIRDLTGVDIRPTQTFPVDPANEAGFDNTGESLTMSPVLLKKYLEAARKVADYLVFTPHGLRFAPHPVVTDTDRDKYCVKRIVDFYQRQPTRYADYFLAAWRYRYRAWLGKADASLEDFAAEQAISPKYLKTIWDTLNGEPATLGPLVKLQAMWNSLPTEQLSEATTQQQSRIACLDMQEYVVQVRKEFEPEFANLKIREVHDGTQPFVLWKNKQYARHRRRADFSFLDVVPSTPAELNAKRDEPGDDKRDKQTARNSATLKLTTLPTAAERERFVAASEAFCSVFPDAFYISERGRDYLGVPKDQQEKGRLLSAGFHSMTGYFRDDQPLYELILDDSGQRELDDLWRELDFFAAAPQRQYQGFLWFDRTDSRFMRDEQFDFARPENKEALTESSIEQLGKLYAAKAAAKGGAAIPLQAIDDYFVEINQQIRWVDQARTAAEPQHLRAVIEFATRANRRPLTPAQVKELRDFYRELREVDQLTHEEAIQDTLVSVLLSPNFCYRIDVLSDSQQPRALDDYELASRLSYFLWSSIPDAELLRLAAAGELHQPQVLLAQTQRMIKDDRVRGWVIEFGGNWLDCRRFEEHNSVDRQRFPSFNDELRSAMFEEPIRFMLDIVQQDRSILDLLYADRTFVNAVLAKHYGMQKLSFAEAEWAEVPDAKKYGRGGLLPMAVFLTKNAPGLRTSPVKRGYWVVRRLLGQRIPPPPPNVPVLPNDESQLGELTLRETLAQHRDHVSCAGCHNRFDAIGLVFEGFGPIGERREVDLGGRAVDTRAIFPDGSERTGIQELKQYLEEQRQAEFIDNLCRKLLSYALGRALLLSDELLVQKMQAGLQSSEYRFTVLIEAIVTSPQFLNKRGRE